MDFVKIGLKVAETYKAPDPHAPDIVPSEPSVQSQPQAYFPVVYLALLNPDMTEKDCLGYSRLQALPLHTEYCFTSSAPASWGEVGGFAVYDMVHGGKRLVERVFTPSRHVAKHNGLTLCDVEIEFTGNVTA